MFNDAHGQPFTMDERPPLNIRAQPFVWRDPRTFPRRRWVLGHHLIRKFVSATVAPGAAGKTSLLLVEAISLALGRSLIGEDVHEACRVWIINLEDPLEELERRVIAICLHYGINPAALDGRLFLNSGRDTEVVIATTMRTGTVIAEPVVEALTAAIVENQLDVVILDPLVKAHAVNENDNYAIDAVCKAIARIADSTDTAWDLVHHVRKAHGPEITVEDGRGASALLAAARSARVLNPMTKEEAERAGLEKHRGYFRTDNGKANLAPPPDRSSWFRLASVSLENGGDNPFDQPDHVAVVVEWEWPDALADVTVSHLREVQTLVAAGRYRENHQATDWVGNVVAQVLKLDPKDKADRRKILGLLKTWTANGMFVVVSAMDEKKRELKAFVEVGAWATD